jgi:CRISPR-associated protein Csx14
MKTPEPTFSVNVDVTNPGQFFACCGLLELAHRFWPVDGKWLGCEGWFEKGTFHVTAPSGEQSDALTDALAHCALEPDRSRPDKALWPMCLREFGLMLDWWIDSSGQKTPLKLWAGQQTSLGIVEQLREAITQLSGRPVTSMFDADTPLTGRFGVDPRAAWQALDVGFSPNEQGMEVATYPLVELLAAAGLQGFRPVSENGSLCYATWNVPLSACVGRAACAGLIPAGNGQRYRFRIAARGSYKGFEYAIPTGGNT